MDNFQSVWYCSPYEYVLRSFACPFSLQIFLIFNIVDGLKGDLMICFNEVTL